MLPGKKYVPEELIRILLRDWWIIVIPLVLATAASWMYARRVPDRYQSETLIMVVPQRIPDSYVKSTVTTRLEDRLATLRDQILSRTRLERIIVDLDLYQEERRTVPMEDIVQRMRNEIDAGAAGKESFRLSYISGSAALAQQVTARLASLFIDENLRDRENVALDTNRFLDSQLEDAKRRLIDQESKLEAYRRQYSGQLPSQLNANLQAIQNAQMQRTAVAQASDRDRERRLNLERQLADLQLPDLQPNAGGAPLPAAAPDTAPGQTTGQQLEAARAGLKLLEARNTPDHPDVRLMKRRIADLEKALIAETSAASSGATSTVLSPGEMQKQRRIREVRGQIADVDRQLGEHTRQDDRLRDLIREYQAKIDAVPTRESELVELTRDYSTVQTSYQNLLAKREESKIAANLEQRNIGEQFRVLDPARVPERPFSPDRRQIMLIGAGAGAAFGLLLVAFREYRDSGLHTEEDIVRVLQLPVLVVIPLAQDSTVRRPWWRPGG